MYTILYATQFDYFWLEIVRSLSMSSVFIKCYVEVQIIIIFPKIMFDVT